MNFQIWELQWTFNPLEASPLLLGQPSLWIWIDIWVVVLRQLLLPFLDRLLLHLLKATVRNITLSISPHQKPFIILGFLGRLLPWLWSLSSSLESLASPAGSLIKESRLEHDHWKKKSIDKLEDSKTGQTSRLSTSRSWGGWKGGNFFEAARALPGLLHHDFDFTNGMFPDLDHTWHRQWPAEQGWWGKVQASAAPPATQRPPWPRRSWGGTRRSSSRQWPCLHPQLLNSCSTQPPPSAARLWPVSGPEARGWIICRDKPEQNLSKVQGDQGWEWPCSELPVGRQLRQGFCCFFHLNQPFWSACVKSGYRKLKSLILTC